MPSTEWQGENPFYLLSYFEPVIELDGERLPSSPLVTRIDLDERGWLTTYGHIFRRPGELHLVKKQDDAIVLSVVLFEGEQGYYVARHIGTVGSSGGSETIAYGIGKKRSDGNEDNLWYLPWGQVCIGKDVEYFAIDGLRKGRSA